MSARLDRESRRHRGDALCAVDVPAWSGGFLTTLRLASNKRCVGFSYTLRYHSPGEGGVNVAED